jgi:hypothetical protein
MEESVSNVFDAIAPEFRSVVMKELERRNPELFEKLSGASEPSNDQSDAVVDALYHALSSNYGPGHIPNEYGKIIDNAIGAYLLAWPIYR